MTVVTELQRGAIGFSTRHLEADRKTRGEFAYASDLEVQGALFGATLRSPHASARITGIETSAAERMPGVRAVLTHRDVPGRPTYGLEVPDQPVLAIDRVRFHGEPVALVAADTVEQARAALRAIAVGYEELPVLSDPEAAIAAGAPALHPGGNVLRRIDVRHGVEPDHDAPGLVVVRGDYELGMQDQAFLGPEAGVAIPTPDGGVEMLVATQWLHADQEQMAASLALPPEKVRLELAGVGGAFGGREDLSVQIHASMLALRTGRPVKVVYRRDESFLGHVHRHGGVLQYAHAATRDGLLAWVEATIVLDGGAYASSSRAVCLNAASTAVGPYRCPSARIASILAYTNNPPCGAMRGFGAVQACFAVEAQMDLLAAELGMDPVALRLRNAAGPEDVLPTGQRFGAPAPVAELLERVRDMPPASEPQLAAVRSDLGDGVDGARVRRGVGWAMGFKNVGFSGGFDDHSHARVTVRVSGGELEAIVHTAACEVGQGVVTVQEQIARTELPVTRVVVQTADTAVGNAGSTSASRQTWVTGGAVRAACRDIAGQLRDRAGELEGVDWEEVLGDQELVAEAIFRPRPTEGLDADGQGDAHFAFAYAAHRATVDVDLDLGLVRLVEVATAQDVGRAINPVAVEGQIHGGIAQGAGLALLEEVQTRDGLVVNGSFTDYLLPTVLDVGSVRIDILELGHPDSPYGLNGVGEPPTIASTAAIAAAVRAATGRPVRRVPIRPEHLVG